jgi:hypothetical protein
MFAIVTALNGHQRPPASSDSERIPSVSSTFLPRRVLSRALLALGHQKHSLLLGSGMVAAMISYLSFAPLQAPIGGVQGASAAPDCADAVMNAIVAHGAPPVQPQVFQCMDPDLRQSVLEQGLAPQYRSIASTAVSKVSRVGTHSTASGAELVYYAVDAGDQSVGFVVQLSPDGRVKTIS